MPSLASRLLATEADRLTDRARANEVTTPFAARWFGPGSASPNNPSNFRALRNGHRRSSRNGNATKQFRSLVGAQ